MVPSNHPYETCADVWIDGTWLQVVDVYTDGELYLVIDVHENKFVRISLELEDAEGRSCYLCPCGDDQCIYLRAVYADLAANSDSGEPGW